jgi:hypothetical protein
MKCHPGRKTDLGEFIRFREDQGHDISKPTFEKFSTRKEAQAREQELILMYGRIDLGTGTLLNRNIGGGGPIHQLGHSSRI